MGPRRARGVRRYAVSVEVPRAGGWRAWNTAADRFERRLAAQVAPPVLDAQVDSETRHGLAYVRIRVTVAVEAADVGGAVAAAWDVFAAAAGEVGGWDTAAARAEVHPAEERPARVRPVERPLLAGCAGYGHAYAWLASFCLHDVATGT
jgi:hypothetical protein